MVYKKNRNESINFCLITDENGGNDDDEDEEENECTQDVDTQDE